ncbi:MAG: tetrahydrofolate dehydrogenase/cyclohydrolase catalytic domain-containing protein, partial [Candidatus Fonsibacter sp.]
MIIDGKKFAKALRAKIKSQILKIKKRKKLIPGLTVILVGDHPASAIYVKNKQLSAKEVGINSSVLRFKSSISQQKLITVV